MSVLSSELKPINESILLKSSHVPVSWAAVAEVKPITHDVGRALAGLNGAVVVSASESPSIYFVVERLAPNQRSAEDAVMSALRETAMSLAARLLNVFATPGDVFDDVKVAPASTANWLVPALLLAGPA